MILGIDPGPTISGWVLCDNKGAPVAGDNSPNEHIDEMLDDAEVRFDLDIDLLVIEMVKSYGIGNPSLFETCVWAGQFIKGWNRHNPTNQAQFMYRNDVLKILFGKRVQKADSRVRTLMIEKFGDRGTKKNPGPTYICTKHMWQALGLVNAFIVRDGK